MKKPFSSLGEKLGWKTIGVSHDEELKFLKRYKKCKEINRKYSPKQYINVEYSLDSLISNISAPKKVGFYDGREIIKRFNKYYTQNFGEITRESYVLDDIYILAKNLIDENITYEELVPDLRDVFKSDKSENIVIGVGSSDTKKVSSPKRMTEYIKMLCKYYPNEKVVLLGNGKKQEKYADDLIKLLPNVEFENLVGKLPLLDSLQYVADSKIFMGFDSGMYNLRYALHKNVIVLVNGETRKFYHNAPWVYRVEPNTQKIDDFYDKEYPHFKINNIDPKKVENAIKRSLEECQI